MATASFTDTTTSTTYGDLSGNSGPAVTVDTGTAALVSLTVSSFSTGNASWMSFAVSGATTLAATDTNSIQFNSTAGMRWGAVYLISGLTAGSNTFTCKYRISTSGTATYGTPRIGVVPL